MHFQEIRRVRGRGKARRLVHFTFKCSERKNLHISVVLVHHPLIAHSINSRLQGGHNILAQDARLPTSGAVPAGAQRGDRHDSATKQNG